MFTLSEYTGGIDGWVRMISRCPDCGEIVAEFYCDDDGMPVETIFDSTEFHECEG